MLYYNTENKPSLSESFTCTDALQFKNVSIPASAGRRRRRHAEGRSATNTHLSIVWTNLANNFDPFYTVDLLLCCWQTVDAIDQAEWKLSCVIEVY
jgi:hypothetical protein